MVPTTVRPIAAIPCEIHGSRVPPGLPDNFEMLAPSRPSRPSASRAPEASSRAVPGLLVAMLCARHMSRLQCRRSRGIRRLGCQAVASGGDDMDQLSVMALEDPDPHKVRPYMFGKGTKLIDKVKMEDEIKWKRGKWCEVYSPSGKWRTAQVVETQKDGVKVHYEGYDAQFDEFVKFGTNRLRQKGLLSLASWHKRKQSVSVVDGAGFCPGCGAKFQCDNKLDPGYTPAHVLEEAQVSSLADLAGQKLNAQDEVALLLKEETTTFGGTVESEKAIRKNFIVKANVFLDIRKEPDFDAERVPGQFLEFGNMFEVSEVYQHADTRNYLKLADGRGWVFDWAEVNGVRMQLVQPVEETSSDELRRSKRQQRDTVCLRCWGLWLYNDMEDVLRPGFKGSTPWTGGFQTEITPEYFEQVLENKLVLADNPTIVAVVDIFDFGPSFKMLQKVAKLLEEKSSYNVHVVANKTDLLPPDVHLPRVQEWVANQAQLAGLEKVGMMDIWLVCCVTNKGIRKLHKHLTRRKKGQNFIVGAANAGKSHLISRLSFTKAKMPMPFNHKIQVRAKDQTGQTVSVVPGTTLKPITLRDAETNVQFIDMPGLLVPGTYTSKLTLEDLKMVVPKRKHSYRMTFPLAAGSSMLLGALGRVDVVETEGRTPVEITVFAPANMTFHRCRTEKAEEFARRKAGDVLVPPVDPKRFDVVQPFHTAHRFELEGTGWKEACVDVVFPGYCWVAITAAKESRFVVEAVTPEGVEVMLREPLLPYEARWTGVKYYGRPGWYMANGSKTKGYSLGKARAKFSRGQRW